MFFRKKKEIEKLKDELFEAKRENFRLRNYNHVLKMDARKLEKVGIEVVFPDHVPPEAIKQFVAGALSEIIADHVDIKTTKAVNHPNHVVVNGVIYIGMKEVK